MFKFELALFMFEFALFMFDAALFRFEWTNQYYPELIDSSGLVAIAGYLNPATTYNMKELYRDDIVLVERSIIALGNRWNMNITFEQITNFRNKNNPYNFNATLEGIEPWNELGRRNRSIQQIVYSTSLKH